MMAQLNDQLTEAIIKSHKAILIHDIRQSWRSIGWNNFKTFESFLLTSDYQVITAKMIKLKTITAVW